MDKTSLRPLRKNEDEKRRNKKIAAAFISALSECGFSETVSNASSDPSWAFAGETTIKLKIQ